MAIAAAFIGPSSLAISDSAQATSKSVAMPKTHTGSPESPVGSCPEASAGYDRHNRLYRVG